MMPSSPLKIREKLLFDILRTPLLHTQLRKSAEIAVVAEALRGAREQLESYLADAGLRRFAPSVRHVGLAVVFHGWELAGCEAVEPGSDGGGHAG